MIYDKKQDLKKIKDNYTEKWWKVSEGLSTQKTYEYIISFTDLDYIENKERIHERFQKIIKETTPELATFSFLDDIARDEHYIKTLSEGKIPEYTTPPKEPFYEFAIYLSGKFKKKINPNIIKPIKPKQYANGILIDWHNHDIKNIRPTILKLKKTLK